MSSNVPPGRTIDLAKIDAMSDEQLSEIRDTIDAEMKRREARKTREARKQIVELAQAHNIDLSSLSGQKPKYRDPKNQFNTWSGRGRKPEWLRAYLAEGRDIEDFRVA
ncbi:regulatory protein [Caballeronia choica]|uniref:Regulatory protein n=1 Tax=Caballeronia choica TaxID=326476 RepID=A0A158KWX9_9BURK|nr:H-NS histone family protein [Caballeronia choica]SAL84911.1 regulatory protein [Caballeronia choica]